MNISKANIPDLYKASDARYKEMKYRRCGHSGIDLPMISLGLWHNFGFGDNFETARSLLRTSFDLGITHFDLANNYGPPYGAAETTFGRIMEMDFRPYRDELIISSKAGWDMWPGPYGNFGSRKYLIASLDQSLKRMGIDYVDIFYHHRPDPQTPLEETMGALHHIVQQGKALYVGVSQYSAEDTLKAARILKEMGTHLFIHQPRYSMMDRWVENGLLDALEETGTGAIAFSPLEQGILTNKYLKGFPSDSRAVKDPRYLQQNKIKPEVIEKVKSLNEIAENRGQTMAQLAIAWLLKDHRITSVLVGASKVSQMVDNVGTLKNIDFSKSELESIESILAS